MRVLVFHGYLLRGTGSNIYNASLARSLVRLGHEVHLLCQDRRAGDLPFVDAVATFRGDELQLETLREPVRCTAYLPDIGRMLPVYVVDDYEGFDAVAFAGLDDGQLDRYLNANVAAVRAVAERTRPHVALANHALMGPAVLARALGGDVPYAVKIHGSALEYTVRPHPQRFLPYVRDGLRAAAGILVGSRHTAQSLWELLDDGAIAARTRLGPPGVDVAAFRPRSAADAARGLAELADRLDADRAAEWGGDPGAAASLRALDPSAPPVVYVGKLILSKGVDLLVAAWPLVSARLPSARLCIVGFGTYRAGLERLVRALRAGDLERALELAARGRELEGGSPAPLSYLTSFLNGLEGTGRDAYAAAAARAFERLHFTGRLEHEDLADLLPACHAQVVPSTFPEAFGMVAAEAACCGALPVSAAHSGLAEVTASLAPALEPGLQHLLSFGLGPDAVYEIAARLVGWLSLDPRRRASAALALSDSARAMYSWESVAEGVIAAAQGRLGELPSPVPPRVAQTSVKGSP